MKLHHKIIFFPVIVMTLIFALGMVGVEYQVKATLQQKFEGELEALSSFALSAIELVDHDFDEQLSDPAFDLLADRLGRASHARISFFSFDGNLLGDSELTFAEVDQAANYSDRTEIMAAIANQIGSAKRYSNTVHKAMVYLAEFDRSTGFIARVALPAETYNQTLINIRWGFTLIILVTILVIIISGLVALRLIKNAVLQERNLLEKRIITRTKEITLLQTMTTLINNANNMTETGIILANILPKLLPKISGAFYLVKVPEKALLKMTQWGNNWPSNVSVSHIQQQNQQDFKIIYSPTTDNHQANVQVNHREQIFSVKLGVAAHYFGVLCFIDPYQHIDTTTQSIIEHLVEPVNSALANVQLRNQLRDQAIRDPLTGLYNRRFMLDALEQALHRAERHGNHVAVLMIDLDHFKMFNDRFGHDAGDLVLSQVAEQFVCNLRLEDIACRYGGEEFCLICPDTNLRDAYQLAEKLRTKVGQLSLSCQEQKLDAITMSIGIAIYPNHALKGDELIIRADKALYLAKKNGRNCSFVFQTATKSGSLSG